MFARAALIAAAIFTLASCDQVAVQTPEGGGDAAQLEAPASGAEPSRVFAPVSDAARAASGDLTVAMSLSLPDASEQSGSAQETLTLTGANGLAIEAAVTSAVSPATQVQGQTLRALMSLPVEEPQTLVYRVSSQTKPSSGQGICGADDPAFVVVWEPSAPGEETLKVLGVTGGAPGAAGARACPLLEYRRS
ncbi:hypothetical protein U91I_02304 [alpha proteobacterium U9-1i]|nr:hypothetical protein U91I_02304 [alpha proteobacterium U9-1i]